MSSFISLQKAIDMTTLYRHEKENILAPAYRGQDILAICETLDRDIFDVLLAKPDCTGIRIYYGMDESLKVNAMVVAVNSKNEDILPEGDGVKENTGDYIGDETQRCPPDCPPPSDLNS